jgi:hypothetical protein
VHQRQNVEELRKHIAMLHELSTNVPAAGFAEWQWDLDTAVKGIVQEKKTPKKKLKPELVLDLDEYY